MFAGGGERLVAFAADEGDELGLLAFAERRDDLVEREMAQADDGETDAFFRRQRSGRGTLLLLGPGVDLRQVERVGFFFGTGGGEDLTGERGGGESAAGAGEERTAGNGGVIRRQDFVGHEREKEVSPESAAAAFPALKI